MSDTVSREQLVNALKGIGVSCGDTLLIHSFLGAFGHFQNGLDTIVEALQEVVGQEGTLVMPTYTIRFLGGHGYDAGRSVSETGILSEYFRWLGGVRRTHCPVYSHAVWGRKQAEYLAVRSAETLGPKSLFAHFHKDNALCIQLGTSMSRGTTFLHYFERMVNAPYRFLKLFEGQVTRDGVTSVESVQHYARYLHFPVEINFDPLESELVQTNLTKACYINRGKILATRLVTLYDEAYKHFQEDPYYLVHKP